MIREKTCCFMGKANEKTDRRDPLLMNCLREELLRLITQNGVIHFISGMEDSDLLAAEVVLSLKKDYPAVTLECAYPYEEQAADWPEEERDRYFSVAEQSDGETIIAPLCTADWRARRNRYLLDASRFILAIGNVASSPDAAALRAAEADNHPIVYLRTLT